MESTIDYRVCLPEKTLIIGLLKWNTTVGHHCNVAFVIVFYISGLSGGGGNLPERLSFFGDCDGAGRGGNPIKSRLLGSTYSSCSRAISFATSLSGLAVMCLRIIAPLIILRRVSSLSSSFRILGGFIPLSIQ